jgi:hypothetical protein
MGGEFFREVAREGGDRLLITWPGRQAAECGARRGRGRHTPDECAHGLPHDPLKALVRARHPGIRPPPDHRTARQRYQMVIGRILAVYIDGRAPGRMARLCRARRRWRRALK